MASRIENAVKFELKLGHQMKKKTKQKWSGDGVVDKMKKMKNLGILNKN